MLMEKIYYSSWDEFFKKNKQYIENKIKTRIDFISQFDIYDLEEKIDNLIFNIKKNKSLINIIIPCKGRVQNLLKSVESLLDNQFENFTITIVEYSESKEFENLFNNDIVNYIYIPSKLNEFNKSLCMNIGALSVESEYCLFHDLDLWVEDNFISSVYKNIKDYNLKLIQCFSDLKIFNLDRIETFKFFNDKEFIKKNKNNFKCIYEYQPPGGSICIEKKLFVEIGGYDDNLMENWGSEDSLFKLKIEKIINDTLRSCINPEVKVFHLYHDKMVENKINYKYYEEIRDFDDNFKIYFIESQKNRFLNKFKKLL